jgi:release factor glutamine methyltransferase
VTTTFAALLEEGRLTLTGEPYASYEPDELLARAAGRPRSWFTARLREAAGSEVAGAFRALVSRRAGGEPLQYLLGEWEFRGRTFRVDPRALIPRGETEGIVEIALGTAPHARRLLDLGTGSGILVVTLALEVPGATLVAVDRSLDALALARENALSFGVLPRIAFLASDWLTALASAALGRAERPSTAVANPPYVPLVDRPHLDRTVSEHEPALALFGGDDGLDPLRILLRTLPPFLSTGAPFIFEIGYGQASTVSDLVAASGHFRLEAVRLDVAGIPRTATAVRV